MRVVGVALATLGMVAGLVCLVLVFSEVGGPLKDTLTSPTRSAPLDETLALKEGRYTVFELTGHRTRTGGVEMHNSHPPTISASEVVVSDPSGARLPVDAPGSVTETVTRGSDSYVGVARFDVPAAGDYRIEVDPGERADVIIAPSLGTGFARVAWWIVAGGLSLLAMLLGLALVLWSFFRRRTPPTAAAPPLAAPPLPVPTSPVPGVPEGWYPDPHAAHLLRYWDGTAWTAHVQARP